MSPLSGTAFLGRDRPEACAFLTVGRIATTWRCSARLIRERFYLRPKIGFTSVNGLTPTKTVMRSGVLNSNGLCASGFSTSGPVRVALVEGGAVSLVSAVVGVFTVVRGQSFAGHSLGDLGTTGGSGAL